MQVLDTTVDAETVSESPETAFMDYDSQCEALQMGKQNKMDIMSAEEVQENLCEDYFQENTNPFTFDDQNFPTVSIIAQQNVLVKLYGMNAIP